MGLTQALGQLVSDAAAAGTSDSARAQALRGVLDCMAALIAGRRQMAVELLCETLAPLPHGDALEWSGLTRTDAQTAALINATAAHVLDFDDVGLRGHPSVVMVPALLALGEQCDAGGEALLDAYVIGYQVWAELIGREAGYHHTKGWHPTRVFGTVAVAAASAALLRLTAQQSAHALGLAASESAGLTANFGAMAKSLHAGRAAQAGIFCARLAQRGFTASPDALEHPQGFLAAFSPQGHVDTGRPVVLPAQEWAVESSPASIKKYPTCFYTHRAIDAALALRERHQFDATDVADIDVHISREHAAVLRNHAPATGLEAKFSIEFAIACALAVGRVGLAELTDAVVNAPAMQVLMRKVRTVPAQVYATDWPGAAEADHLVVRLTDGTVLAGEPVRHAMGHAKRPLPMADLEAKFLDCVSGDAACSDPQALLMRLRHFTQQRVRTLWS